MIPKVVFYTRTSFLDPALSLVRELSKKCELHLFVEVTPKSWSNALFDIPPRAIQGIFPGETLLKGSFPEGVRKYWSDTASFQFVIHDQESPLNLRTLLFSNRVTRAISDLHPHILHVDDISPRLVMGFPSLVRIPIVLNIHDPKPHQGEETYQVSFTRKIIKPRVRKYILFNQSLLEHFCNAYSVPLRKVSTTHLGMYDIYREWIQPGSEDKPFDILFFGRLSPYKGLDVLLDALVIAARSIPNLKTVIAGRRIPGYKTLILPQLSNGGTIQTIDRYIDNYELADLFQRAKLIVCPYRDATQSGVILTAFAFNKPVLASNIGGLGEYISEQTGILVPSGDVVVLAQRISSFLGDPSMLLMYEKGIEAARNGFLAWENAGKDILEAYQQVLTPFKKGVSS
jgi:glycosyltransferase involved in cell wall biosynthesis